VRVGRELANLGLKFSRDRPIDKPNLGKKSGRQMPSRILLVEDNPDDAELTRMALDRHHLGRRVIHLTDGAQALDYLLSPAAAVHVRNVRFVILDLHLPKVDGIQVIGRLKADPRTRAIPLIMLSSSDHEKDISRSLDLGANSYVVKPMRLDDYMDRVSALGRYWHAINERRPVS
jgi:DNA-binding response OmpR family regulator